MQHGLYQCIVLCDCLPSPGSLFNCLKGVEYRLLCEGIAAGAHSRNS